MCATIAWARARPRFNACSSHAIYFVNMFLRILISILAFIPILSEAQSYSSGKIVSVRDAGVEIVAKGCARPSNIVESQVQTLKPGVMAVRRSFRCPDAEMSVIGYEGRTIPYTLVVTGD